MAKYATYLLVVLLLFAGFVFIRLVNVNTLIGPVSLSVESPLNLDKFDFQNWHEFSPPDKKFTVLLPTIPQHAADNIKGTEKGDKKYEMFVSQKNDGSIFMITLITFKDPEKTKDREALLRELMDDMVNRNSKNKIKNISTGKFKDYDSLDYSFGNADTHVDAKSFLVDETVYILTRAVSSKNYTADEYKFFVNSFDIPLATQQTEK